MHYSELPTIRKGSNGANVIIARRAINQWIERNNAGDALLSSERSDFNASVACYAMGFQARHVDPNGIALAVDGIVGSNTWFALGDYSDEIDNQLLTEAPIVDLGQAIDIVSAQPADTTGVSPTALAALQTAMREIGVQEDPPNSNSGPRVETYQSEGPNDNPDTGLAWCASFVSWCHYKTAEDNTDAMPFTYSASSRRIERDLRENGSFRNIETEQDLASVRPGDILVWFRCGDLNPQNGHIGFVHHYDNDSGHLFTVEGNRNNRVWAGRYQWDSSNADRLIRGLIGYGRV